MFSCTVCRSSTVEYPYLALRQGTTTTVVVVSSSQLVKKDVAPCQRQNNKDGTNLTEGAYYFSILWRYHAAAAACTSTVAQEREIANTGSDGHVRRTSSW